MAFMISEMVAPPLRWSMAITWAILLPSRKMAFMISEMVAPPLRWSMAITWAILLPSLGPPPSFPLAAFLAALGAFLAGVALLLALAFGRALWAARAPPLAFFPAVGFAFSASGCVALPSPW